MYPDDPEHLRGDIYHRGEEGRNDHDGGEYDNDDTAAVPASPRVTHPPPMGVDQVPGMEPLRRTSAIRRESFLVEFASSKGPPQIVILIMLLALGFGSTIGVVRGVVGRVLFLDVDVR